MVRVDAAVLLLCVLGGGGLSQLHDSTLGRSAAVLNDGHS